MSLRPALCLCIVLLLPHAAPVAWAAKSDKVQQLVANHDLRLSIATGNLYLKQQALLEIRSLLAALGRDGGLGETWNRFDPQWQSLERDLLDRVNGPVQARFAQLDWLARQWEALDERDFSEADIDQLLAHFRTEFGRKQLMIVDHGVATHVSGALTFSGRLLYDVPGAEAERAVMQRIYSEEEEHVHFRIDDSPEGMRFAVSALGKRYFINAMVNVAGMVSERIDEMAAQLRQSVKALAPAATAAIDALHRGRSG